MICKFINVPSYAKKHVLGAKWYKLLRIRRCFRVVASSYQLRLAYIEDILLVSLNSLSKLNF